MTVDARTTQLRLRLGLIGMEMAVKRELMNAVPEVDNIHIRVDHCRFTEAHTMTFGWTYKRDFRVHHAGPYPMHVSEYTATPTPTPEMLNAVAVAMRMEKP